MPYGKSSARDVVVRRLENSKTRLPGYAAILPKVFPYYVKTTVDSASVMASALWERSVEAGAGGGGLYHAVSGHPSRLDGEVTLWLSWDSAKFLLESDMLPGVIQSIGDTRVERQN